MKIARGVLVAVILAVPLPASAYSLLHSHVYQEAYPLAPLVSDGAGHLYGTASDQGTYNGGAVFTVRANGTGYAVLHYFRGSFEGFAPHAGLVLDSLGNLYGTTHLGGASNSGTVFTLRTDGTGFTLLHSFIGGASDGQGPESGLVLDGSGNLFGTTVGGGASNLGTVFTLQRNGTGFTLLHAFAGGVSDGGGPFGGLILDGSGNLYGTTAWSGVSSLGTVFTLKKDGTGFALLHSFAGGASDSRYPGTGLTLDGSGNLYGTTLDSGASSSGTVFTLKTDGTGFALLHTFTGGDAAGRDPLGGLILDGSGNLYGTTVSGGASNYGSVFAVKTDGSGLTIVHTFAGGANDGVNPHAGLTLDSSGNLYGTTYYGGASNHGAVFTVRTDGTGFVLLHSLAGGASDGANPYGMLILDGSGKLYGTTSNGGAWGSGSLFSVEADGTAFTLLHSFSGSSSDGAGPYADLTLDGSGNLYGTTQGGGAWGLGTVFTVKTDGTAFALLHSFAGGDLDGAHPFAGLILDGSGNLYGTTLQGGASGLGLVYTVKTDGTGFTLLHSFAGGASDGANPYAALTLDGAGDLYGTTLYGAASGYGTVFTVKIDGTGFMILHSFSGGSSDSELPISRLILDGSGNLYGTTAGDYASSHGTVFTVKTDGTAFAVIHSFAGGVSDGQAPDGGLILDASGNLYGTTVGGGASDTGMAYTIRTDGTGFALLHSFAGGILDGALPYAGLILDASGNLYGTTTWDGSGGVGTEFTLPSLTSTPVVTAVVTGGRTICSGQSIGLQASLTGIGPWNLTWSDGFTQMAVPTSPATRTVSPSVTTAYSITTIWNASGLGASAGAANVIVNPTPTAPSVSSNSPICGRGTINLSASSPVVGATYSWSGPGFTSTSQDPSIPNATPAMSGTYTVTVTTPDGCTSPAGTVDVLVTLRPAVTAPAPITIDQTTCCGPFGGATPDGSAALAAFLAAGSAIDGCDPSPTRLPAQVGGADVTGATCFAAGTTPVTFRFENADGRAGTATSDVTVRMFGDLNADAAIDPSDFVILRAYFNFVVAPGTPPFAAPLRMADLTHDATVDPSDMVILRAYFNFVVGCLAP